ncbi:MAG: ornithine carbamoyltransferase [Candidatus Omnitrophica bacterium]|nr:ornithine carbamoyltransferase [Candidatus Omnitrophota bacterium]MDD5488108.1 ornithine carbamoyltransferase [Candidatus Omnitrophota bacterium]
MSKDLITIQEMTTSDIMGLMRSAAKLKKAPLSKKKVFKDKTLALLFQKPSNRTRVSFEVAMVHLGGYVLYLSPREIKMGERESVKDVARVISRYVDGMVARVFSHKDVEDLAKYSDVPVINGLSDLAHPCQALSDVFTVKEKFGRMKGVTMSYVGDGNNVLNSLMLVCAKTGVDLRIATPKGYAPAKDILAEAQKTASSNGSSVEVYDDPKKAVAGSDVVYTDVWVSMGQEHEKAEKIRDFAGFQVNEELMSSAKKDAFVMHCLPAHRGEEISEDVIDGKNSIIYDQAENRLHVQKAVLLSLLGRK